MEDQTTEAPMALVMWISSGIGLLCGFYVIYVQRKTGCNIHSHRLLAFLSGRSISQIIADLGVSVNRPFQDGPLRACRLQDRRTSAGSNGMQERVTAETQDASQCGQRHGLYEC